MTRILALLDLNELIQNVTPCVQHLINSHPLFYVSEWLFHVILKIQGQGHSSSSHSASNILSTHTPSVPCQSTLPFLRYSYFKMLPWKFIVGPHSGSNILLTHIPAVPCHSTLLFLKYSYFTMWPWKSAIIRPLSVHLHVMCIIFWICCCFDLRMWVRAKFKVT